MESIEIIDVTQGIVQSNLFNLLMGFILGIVSSIVIEKRKTKEEVSLAKSMLSREIECNLEIAKDLYKRVESIRFLFDITARTQQDKAVLANRLAQTPWAGWQKAIWQGQQSIITKAITMQQAKEVQLLYQEMEEIAVIWETMKKLEDIYSKDKEGIDRSLKSIGLPENIIGNPQSLYDQLHQKLTTISISRKNPIVLTEDRKGLSLKIPNLLRVKSSTPKDN